MVMNNQKVILPSNDLFRVTWSQNISTKLLSIIYIVHREFLFEIFLVGLAFFIYLIQK